MRKSHRALLNLNSACFAVCLTAGVQAQTILPPTTLNTDGNGVDLTDGTYNFQHVDISIGNRDHHGLQYIQSYGRMGWATNFDIQIITSVESGQNYVYVQQGSIADKFLQTGSSYSAVQANGATLSMSGGTYTYTTSNGIVINATLYQPQTGNYLTRVNYITYPDGVRQDFYYSVVSPSVSPCNTRPCPVRTFQRLSSVTNSNGYQLKFSYASNASIYSLIGDWLRLTQVMAINRGVDYCDPSADTCSGLTVGWPTTTYSQTTSGSDILVTVTDAVGTSLRYTKSGSGELKAIRQSSASVDSIVIARTSGKVSSITRDGQNWSYNFVDSSGTRTATVTDPLSQQHIVTSTIATGLVSNDQDELGHSTSYLYDGNGRLTRITASEGNYTSFTYDGRGNITQTTKVSKTPGTPADIVTSAGYDATCANPKTCNQPNWTKDANLNQTDYTYDATHGGVLTVTLPAASSGGVRPQVRYGYSSYQGYFKNSSGSIVASGVPTYLRTLVSQCQTLSSCSGGTDELKTTISYGPQSGGTANNLSPVSTTISRGDGALSATTANAYDIYGRLSTIDGPLAADTSMIRYDLAGHVIGKISPDPDDGATSKFPATRYTYDGWGHAYLAENGTVNSLSDSDWSAFSSTDNMLTEYDGYGRPARVKARDSSNAVKQVVDTGYDLLGRVNCTIVRMDMTNYGSAPPAGTCASTTLYNGVDGYDRMTLNTYDAVGRVAKVQTAYGTSDQADEQTVAFTNNGQVYTVKDAENNLTAYVYDGFDRRIKTYYPNPAKGSNDSNGSDREEVTYDPNGNVTSFRTRAAETLTYSYDNLNRLLVKTVPERSGLSSTYTRDVYFEYDLFGNMTKARFDSLSGEGITNGYDALGRQTSSQLTMDGYSKTLSYGYDAANNRSVITYPDDGTYFQGFRWGSGALSWIGLNGSGPLFHKPYDALGRQNILYRWDTAGANWNQYSYVNGYDGLSRVTSYLHEFAGTSDDVSTTFGYNPAGQLTSTVKNNDLYAWTGAATADTDHTSNGLNQYTNVGGTGFGYDGNGNLTSDGTNTYVYDVENRLVSRSSSANSATVRYDPLGRLYEVNGSATGTTRFLYDGDDLVAEYNGSGTLQRRYVHGEGTDQPLVQFEGSGVADSARRYLYSDERGSVIAVTDSAGNVLNRTGYDEYGFYTDSNATYASRFKYTGQAYVPELGLYYYKARMYSPRLGRFMQTDPIGYEGGMNLYAYVLGDPINNSDPLGLEDDAIVITAKKRGPRVIINLQKPEQSTSPSSGRSGRDSGKKPKEDDDDAIVVTGKRPQKDLLTSVKDWWRANKDCVQAVGKAGFEGVVDPIGGVASIVGGALTAKGIRPPVGGTVTFENAAGELKTLKLARVGVRAAARNLLLDAIPGAAAGAALVGIAKAGIEFYSNEACH